jgi:hypothetical protein
MDVHEVMLDFEHFTTQKVTARGNIRRINRLSEIYSHSNVCTFTSSYHIISLTLPSRDGAAILEARHSWSRYVTTNPEMS